MTITLIFLALLMAAVLWWLFRQSVNTEPWIAHAGAQDVHPGVLDRPAVKTALIVFLAVATSLFALFISAYAMRMHVGDWTALHEPLLLWVNTGVLDSHAASPFPKRETVTFTTPGTYEYFCAVHGNDMDGEIVVQ